MAVKRVVSIEIGLIYTKVCETDYRKKNTRVYKSFVFDTPENTVEDGYIRDKNSFSDELKRQLKNNKIKNKNVVFTIASNKILSREVVMPAVKENRIIDIVQAEAGEYFPMDISEHILTYSVLAQLTETKQRKIMVFAAPMTLIRNYYSLAELLGVNIVALDYIGNSTCQVFKRLPGEEANFTVLLNQQNTVVSIIQNGTLMMQRYINYGVAGLIDLMKTHPDYEAMSVAQCYDELCSRQLLKSRLDEEGEELPEELTELREDLMEELRLFINNIVRVMEYFNTRGQNHRIPKLYLVGKGSKIKGLPALLENETGLPVEIVKRLPGISFKKLSPVLEQHSDELFSCVGAALEPVNFVPPDLIRKSIKKDSMRMNLLLLVLVTAASGTLIYYGYLDRMEAQQRQEELQREIESYLYVEEKYNAYLESQRALEEAKEMEDLSSADSEYLGALIEELEEKLPTNSIVQSFSATGQGIFLSLVTDSKETAAQLLVQLKKIPYIGTVSISGISDGTDAETGNSNVSFSVSLTWDIREEVQKDDEIQ